MFFTKSLKAKMLLPALIPVIFGLATLAITRPYAYKWVVQDVAQQRDTELARVLAARLSGDLDHYSHILEMIAVEDDVQSMEPARLSVALEKSQQRAVFDAGVAVYDGQGLALWPWQETGFPLATEFDELRSTLLPVFSDIFEDDVSGEDVILIGLPIIGSGGELRGVMAGLSTVKYSRLGATFAEVLEFQAGRGGYAYLVDGNGKVIWHRDSSLVGTSLAGAVPVRRVLQEENAAVITEDTAGETVISAFAPVPETGWGLITQERWEGVVSPIQSYTWVRLGQLALGGALAGGLVFWLIGHILRPIQDLTKGAQRIAGGDFDYTIAIRTGDEVEALAQQFKPWLVL
jgi:HAMP domain-containing protein